MKINKIIARGLSIGLFINSVSILSYANTEIPNRYQTLEGEYITIDDSTEGNLEEIEIFGNTTQNENNLEDIQSVGDLYVDEVGNPILDKQGREQYLVEIISNNKNLFDTNNTTPYLISHEGTILNWNGMDCRVTIKTQNWQGFKITNLDKDKTYTISYMVNSTETSGPGVANRIRWFDVDGNMFQSRANNNTGNRISKTVSGVTEFYLEVISLHGITNIVDIFDIQLEEGISGTTYVPHKQKNIEILLPTQLQKVGNVADRLYWDNNKGKYIIEKNIENKTLNGSEEWHSTTIETQKDISIFYTWAIPYLKSINAKFISDKFKQIDKLQPNVEGITNNITESNKNNVLRLKINKSRLKEDSPVGLKEWLKENNVNVWYQTINSKLIETNITSKLKIPTYDEKTHIYVSTENGINPTLKVTVDRLPQIAKEAVAQAENDNTNYNIALARRYINMLPESLYKDQLQNQLSEIFSSDMVLDMKTVTSNLDVYIKSENILQMSLDTNQISFEDFSGIEDVEKINAVNLTINSSLPYQLNAYLPMEIQNSDKSVTMDKSILNIKESSEIAYQTFINTTDKIVLKDNCSAGNYLTHGVDLKLVGGIAHEKDVYKATIKLEAEQK